MADVVLFHSIRGLRPAEHAAAERMRAAGHSVIVPDLFDGRATDSVDEGFALEAEIGWERICERAEAAVAGLPPATVLAGVSMGAGVVGHLWPQRPQTAGVLLLHGVTELPPAPRAIPLQVHLAEPDEYETEDWVEAVVQAAAEAGIAAEVFRYPGRRALFHRRDASGL